MIDTIYKLLNFRIFKILYFFWANLIIFIVKKRISKHSDLIILKGSYLDGRAIIGISDVDFIIKSPNKEKVKNELERVKKIPFIFFDYEVYGNEFDEISKFGGNKYYLNEFRILKGSYNKNYIYYPAKFYMDIVREIFNITEWFFIFNSHKSTFNRLKTKHLIKKINQLILKNRFNFIIREHNFVEDLNLFFNAYNGFKILRNYFNNDSVFYHQIEKDYKLFQYSESYPWKIISSKNDESNNCIYQETFELFYLCGCFSIDELVINPTFGKNKLLKYFCYKSYCSKYFEGNFSYLRSEIESIEKIDLKSLSDHLENFYPAEFKNINFENKNLFIVVNWGSNIERKNSSQAAKEKFCRYSGNYIHIEINFVFEGAPSFSIEDNFIEITFVGSDKNYGLWHKEGLFNLAGFLFLGAKNLIFADNDIYSLDENWLDKINIKLEQNHFVQGFGKVVDTIDESYAADSWVKKYKEGEEYFRAPGLIWGLNQNTFFEMNGLPDDFPEGSGDGALVRELTGVKLSFIDSFPWFITKLRNFQNRYNFDYVDVEVIHINHGRARDYVNRSIFLDLISFDFSRVIDKDEFGLLHWKTTNELLVSPFKLKDYIFEFTQEKFLYLVNELFEKEILKPNFGRKFTFFSPSPHNECIEIEDGGVVIIYQDVGLIAHFLKWNKSEFKYYLNINDLKINHGLNYYELNNFEILNLGFRIGKQYLKNIFEEEAKVFKKLGIYINSGNDCKIYQSIKLKGSNDSKAEFDTKYNPINIDVIKEQLISNDKLTELPLFSKINFKKEEDIFFIKTESDNTLYISIFIATRSGFSVINGQTKFYTIKNSQLILNQEFDVFDLVLDSQSLKNQNNGNLC